MLSKIEFYLLLILINILTYNPTNLYLLFHEQKVSTAF